MKHFYFIGSFYPYGQYDILIKDSKNALGNANDLLQKSFIRGLEENDCMIDLITAPSIGSFPSRYKKIWYNGKSFDYTEKII